MNLGSQPHEHPADDPTSGNHAATAPDDNPQKRLERFVGRAAEMQELLAYAAEARAGRGRLVLVSGEPGIGKTRLATEFAKRAEADGMRVLWGRCWEGDGAPPFWPWVQVLRSHSNIGDEHTTPVTLGPPDPTLTSFSPELSLASAFGQQPSRCDHSASGEDRFRLFDRVSHHLTEGHSKHGLLVILDDIHWADSPSLLLTDFLNGDIALKPILLVATYRNTELRQGGSFQQHLARFLRHTTTAQIALSGLSEHDVAQLLPIGSFPPARSNSLLSQLHDRTQGNPFFVVELLRVLPPTHWDPGPSPDVDIPQTILALVEARLTPLSPVSRISLTRASAIGPDFDALTLAQLSDISPEILLRHLDEAHTHFLLRDTPERPGSFSFIHAIVREALYQSLSPATRDALHLRMAQILEARLHNHDGHIVAAIAQHYFHAIACDRAIAPKAFHYSMLAADNALQLLAFEDAALFFQRALTLLPTPHDPTERCAILLALGDALTRSGHWQAAQTTFADGLALARHLKSSSLFAQAAIGIKGMGRGTLPPNQKAIAALREALAQLDDTTPELRARVMTALSTALYFADESERDATLAPQAIRLALASGTHQTLGDALEAQIFEAWRPHSIDTMLTLAGELLTAGRRANDPDLVFRARISRYVALTQLCSSAASAELAACYAFAQDLNNPRYLWQVLLARASHALLNGDFVLADQLRQQTRLLGGRFHDPTAEYHLALHQFSAARLRGTLTDLSDIFEPAICAAPDYPLPRVAFSYFLAATGDCELATAMLAPVLREPTVSLPQDAFYLITTCLLAETVSTLGDKAAAQRLLPLLEQHSDEIAIGGWGSAIEGSIAHFIGHLQLTLENNEAAEVALRQAVAINTAAAFPLLKARSLGLLSDAIARRDSPESDTAAIRVLCNALEIYKELGVTNRIDQIESYLRELRLGVRQDQGAAGTDISVERVPPCVTGGKGDFCTLRFNGRCYQLRNTKALRQLIYLLIHPNTDVPALVLASIDRNTVVLNATPIFAYGYEGGSPILDPAALSDYRGRLRELRVERDAADERNDLGQMSAIDTEITWLEEMLTQAAGLGRIRTEVSNNVERARVSVRNNLSNAISRISRIDESLGSHLDRSLKTGLLCRYSPIDSTAWQVRLEE